ncbi:hypothetical protein JCM10212_005353 [Sporobolomyces blumeae]
MADPISELLDELTATLNAVWDSVIPSDLPNLHSLPHQLHDALFAPGGVIDKLTNGGTVPLPVPASWLELAHPSPAPAVVSPPAPPRFSDRVHRLVTDLVSHVRLHPYLYALATVSATTGATYYWSPRTLRPFAALVPASLLPPVQDRPLRLLPSTHGVPAEVRKEAALVLGADTVQGREIALDLEKRGWVVIGTVSDPASVDRLEKDGRGWIKVLVLDPTESSSVGPFLRSLSTALSLRFPLHSSGDPFSRPAQALTLTSVVDALSFSVASSPPSSSSSYAPTRAASNDASLDALVPVEALELDHVRREVGERVATFVGVVKGVMPILRAGSARPTSVTGVWILLLPSVPTNLSLPFLSLRSTLSQSLASMFRSLRREVTLSTPSPNLKLNILECGFFDQPSTNSPTSSSSSSSPTGTRATKERQGPLANPLPIRLESLYAPALSRRVVPDPSSSSNPSSASPSLRPLVGASRRPTPLRRLTHKVQLVLTRPDHSYPVSTTGSGAASYHAVFSAGLGTFLLSLDGVLGTGFGWSRDGVIDGAFKVADWTVEQYRKAIDKVNDLRRRTGPGARLGRGRGGGGGGPARLAAARGQGGPGAVENGSDRDVAAAADAREVPAALRPGVRPKPDAVPTRSTRHDGAWSFTHRATDRTTTTTLNDGAGTGRAGGGGYDVDGSRANVGAASASEETDGDESSIEEFEVDPSRGGGGGGRGATAWGGPGAFSGSGSKTTRVDESVYGTGSYVEV